MDSFLPILNLFDSDTPHSTAAPFQNIENQESKDGIMMNELAKIFLDKTCYIHTSNADLVFTEGIIKKVEGSWLLFETKKGLQAVNLNYVVRIEEILPKKDKSKKRKDPWE